jgi:competence protein ComEC
VAGGLLLDRPATPLNSIGAAGFLILLADTSQLFNSGFQLSFAAVTLIILMARPLQARIEALFAPDPFIPTRLISRLQGALLRLAAGIAALVAVSFAAWLASLPLTLYYFHLISFSSIPANLLAVPLSSASLALAAIALVAGAFSSGLAIVFNNANYLLAKVLIFVVQAFASIPGSSLYIGPAATPGTVATLTALDVGAGGTLVLTAGANSWLIDTGSEYLADTATIPFLRLNGINRPDALVFTHGDTRHLGGGERLLATHPPREVLDSGLRDRSPNRKRLLAAVREAGLPIREVHSGDAMTLSPDVRVTVLYPPPGADGVSADDKALVLRVDAGTFRALLMSDAGLATEQWLLTHAREQLPCDVVAMGRHISGFSGGLDFLAAVSPRVVIATAADFPQSEQIRPEWASALEARGITLLRQDATGAVTITVRRDRYLVQPFLPAGTPATSHPLSHASDSQR